jgi:uncharacterized protein
VARTELLRAVVVEDRVVPDPQGRLPGRGASLHPDLGCLDLAERRRVFPRAFRLQGPLDTTALRAYVEQQTQHGKDSTATAPISTAHDTVQASADPSRQATRDRPIESGSNQR